MARIKAAALGPMLVLLAATAWPALAAERQAADRDGPVLRVSRATRALVISPHPDDGVLGAGGLMERIVSRQGSVEVVEMTSGDAFAKGVAAVRRATQLTPGSYRWYGTLREHEVAQAMRQLGIGRSRVRLLGFPDEGVCNLAADRSSTAVFSSPYTRRDSPPTTEQLVAGAKYRGTDAVSELVDVLLAFRPTLIVVPDAHDEHPDHCATHLLVHTAADLAVRRGLRPPAFLHYLIHYRDWPNGATRLPAEPGVVSLRLTDAERAAKRRAIAAYRSQLAVMPAFMHGFERADERFVRDEEEPLAACWCGGENIAPRPASPR